MRRAKSVFILLVGALFVMALHARAGNEQQNGRTAREHTGIIKVKGEESHILRVQTEAGTINFHYKRHGKKQCAGFKELAVGDNVRVTASDDKPVSEATCILKVKPDPVARPK
jgi:hypothetical protein